MANEDTLPTSGKIKWYDTQKGYGFIQIPGGGADVFLHVKHMRASGILALAEGAEVTFTATKGPKGLFATDIKVTNVPIASECVAPAPAVAQAEGA